jgi:hypothetical protein
MIKHLSRFLLLTLALSGLCWGANALIVHDTANGGGIDTDVTANLTAKLITAGFTVTASDGSVPGGSLATYREIWDLRYNNVGLNQPLTASDISAYITYMAAGGSLFVIGENAGFASRNNTIVTLVSQAGGGTISPVLNGGQGTPENVLAPFTGPTPLTQVTFLASSAMTSPAKGRFVTKDPGGTFGTSVVFPPGTMSNAMAGALIAVFDVNFLQAGASANSQIFTANLIGYLAAPYFIPIPGTPAPASLTLVLIGLSAAGFYAVRRKRLNQSLT